MNLEKSLNFKTMDLRRQILQENGNVKGPVVHGAMGCGQKKKKLSVSVVVPPAPNRVPSQRPLPPSVTSVANDKSDNEMILGAVHKYPDICLPAEENAKNFS